MWLVYATEAEAEAAQAAIWDAVKPPAEMRDGEPVPDRITQRWAIPRLAAEVPIIGRIFGGSLASVRPRHRFVVPPALSQGALRAGARPSGGLAGYSFTAEAKDPEAVLGYEVDWGEWLSAGETLVQPAKVRATGNVEIAFERIEEGRFVRWRVSGGVAGEDAFITVAIDTNSGQTDERTIRLPVRER